MGRKPAIGGKPRLRWVNIVLLSLKGILLVAQKLITPGLAGAAQIA
jgi:hypothetical protein